jgi:hypothetical protein
VTADTKARDRRHGHPVLFAVKRFRERGAFACEPCGFGQSADSNLDLIEGLARREMIDQIGFK